MIRSRTIFPGKTAFDNVPGEKPWHAAFPLKDTTMVRRTGADRSIRAVEDA